MLGYKRPTAVESLRTALKTRRELEGRLSDTDVNFEVARNVLHEDLGYVGDRRIGYDLEDDTKDILLAHARQDAAHALLNSVTLLKKQKRLHLLMYVAVGLLAYIAAKVS